MVDLSLNTDSRRCKLNICFIVLQLADWTKQSSSEEERGALASRSKSTSTFGLVSVLPVEVNIRYHLQMIQTGVARKGVREHWLLKQGSDKGCGSAEIREIVSQKHLLQNLLER